MKLDLKKFTMKPTASTTCKNSPTYSNQLQPHFGKKKNSADMAPGNLAGHSGGLSAVDSPAGVVYCYTPGVNVQGNNNIVNTNVSIYANQSQLKNGFSCSQKLFEDPKA
jgi:hypothetical protein